MSRPTWDRETDTVEWDGKRFPVATINGGSPVQPDDTSWVATIPMENRCSLDLHVPHDETESCWVLLSPYPINLTDEQWRGLPDLYADIIDTKITVLQHGVNDRGDPFCIGWFCDVEGPDEVLDYLRRWGRLEVVRG